MALVKARIGFGWFLEMLRLLYSLVYSSSVKNIVDTLVIFVKVSLHLRLLRHWRLRRPARCSHIHIRLVISLALHLYFWSEVLLVPCRCHHRCWSRTDSHRSCNRVGEASILEIVFKPFVLDERLLRWELLLSFMGDRLVLPWDNAWLEHLNLLVQLSPGSSFILAPSV